jgi:hemerythrin
MPITLEWMPELETGIELIDQEHRKLFELAQAVFDDWHKNDELAAGRALIALYKYVRTHFDHEEEIMRELAFPEFDEHRARHEELVAALDELSRPPLDRDGRGPALRLLMFEWVAGHILRHDLSFARFVLERRPASGSSAR